jgi:hypothetical protein
MNFKEKFQEYLQQPHRKSVEIKEPGLEGTIHFTPLTVLEMEKVRTASQGNNAAFNVWLLIEKAEDEEGKKLFSAEDKPFLEKMPWSVITDVVAVIMKIPGMEELKKNLTTTPISGTST